MNLADAKRKYRQAIDECERSLASGVVSAEQCRTAAVAAIDAATRSTMREIDEYTTRRFLPVNTRRGLVGKLDLLHARAIAQLDAVIGNAPSP